ncbi:MAG TPA: hypothetical protein VJM69_01040 [Dehalococcoidia bacterium]|nr:hypothetical protein [Dehalococcoidia bacterium]
MMGRAIPLRGSPGQGGLGRVGRMTIRGRPWARSLHLLLLGAVLLFTTAVYLPSLTEWFSRHDFIHLRGAAQTPALDYVRAIFTPGDGGNSIFATGDLYRPIYYLSFLATYPLFGLDPLGYRLVNLALHLTNIVLVFLLGRRLTGSPWAGLLAAAFFGIHPTLDDSVAWISSITDLLMGFFYLSFLLLFIQALDTPGVRGLGLYVLSLLAGTLALLTREPGVTFPLAAFGYYYLVHKSPRHVLKPATWLAWLPFALVVLGYGIMRWSIGRSQGGPITEGEYDLGWHIPLNIFRYLTRVALPVGAEGWRGLEPLLKGLGAIALLRLSDHYLFKGSKGLRFVVLWSYVALVPVTLMVWEGWLASRYLYLPLAGFAVLIGAFVAQLPSLLPPLRPALGRAGLALGIAVLAVLLATQTVRNEDGLSRITEDSHSFITRLRAAHPDLALGDTLYVLNPPRTMQFGDDDFFFRPAVQLFFGPVRVIYVAKERATETLASLEPGAKVFDYRSLAPPSSEGPPRAQLGR